MEYSAWHSVIQDGNGAIVPMAKITVRSTSTGALAKLYSARDGSVPKANPFNADENGQVFFFVAGGAYTIKAEFGSQERTWPFVPVGTAAEYDIDSLALYLNSGVVYFQKYVDLATYVPLSYPAAAVILADPDALKNGYYTNTGTGWVFGRALQDTISRLFITSGAVNTPTATVGQGINPSAPLVFYVDVTAPNTASVTLNVVGLGQGVVLNAAGNPLAAGEWQGRVMLTRETDGRYRIMNDPASALSASQSATASDNARAASTNEADRAKTEADRASAAAGGLINAVQFVPQKLTPTQQLQARKNIGAATGSGLGVGQTWQDIQHLRGVNTNYINNTGSPIFVNVIGNAFSMLGGATLNGYVDGELIEAITVQSQGLASISLLVPNGGAYRIEDSNSPLRVIAWMELR